MVAKPRIKIEKYKKMLEEQREEILRELKRAEDRAVGREGEQESVAGEDFDEPGGDAAATTAERQQAMLHAQELRHLLDLIEEALRRIEEGTYGVCEICGKAIPASRLELVPWATTCAKCASS